MNGNPLLNYSFIGTLYADDLQANYLFQDKDTVLKPLEKLLGILDIKRFRMNLNIGHELDNQPILKQYERTLEKFRKCSTSSFQNGSKLWLDFWINEDTKKAFKQNFNGGIFELFQAFQVLYTLNYRTADYSTKSEVYASKGYYTQGKISTPGPSERVFYFLDYYISKKRLGTEEVQELLLKQLSDGEQQFLHSLGICLMLKNKSALLLLDEPETHFNPDWRSKFISMLGKSLTAAESNNLMRDVLVTSHSPFIISDCLPDKVIYFRRKKENPRFTEAVSAKSMNFNSFGASVDVILEVLFGKRQTIGNLAKQKLQYDLSKIRTRDDVERIKFEISELGESIEKDILLATLNELEFTNA
jgi:restriction system-associated AAA family ATPase